MMYSLSQVAFVLLFLGTVFLLLIFGETTFGIFFLGLLVAVCGIALTHSRASQVRQFVLPLGLFGSFVAVTFLSLLTTISIPLTVNAAMFYASSYVVFFTVLCTDPEWFPTQLLIVGASILATFFSCLTLLYIAIPALTTTLPTVSLLTAQYGHNQASVLFLLVLPVVWFFADQRKSKLTRVAVLVLFAALILSFSRVATVLAVVELLLLTWKTQDHRLRELGKVLVLFVGLAMVLLAVFSLGWHRVGEECGFPFFQDKLCKSIHHELRPAYWSQAVRATLQRPITGWGGGTFSLLSPVLQQRYGEFSGYAHNEVLHAFAEYGMFGGIVFTAFLALVCWKAVAVLQKNESSLQKSIAIGVLCVVVSSCFDFGLHMIGLWIFFLMAVATLFKNDRKKTISSNFSTESWVTFSTILATLCAVSVLVWATAFLASGIFWRQGKKDLSLQVFPFAYWKVEESLLNDGAHGETNEWWLHLYKNHYRVWDAVAHSNAASVAEKTLAIIEALQLDPFSQQRYLPYITMALSSNDEALSVQAISIWDQKLSAGQLDSYTYQQHGQVAAAAIEEANRLLVARQSSSALQLYQHAYHIQDVQFGSHNISVYEKLKELPIQETLPLLNALKFGIVFKDEQLIYQGESYQLQQSIKYGSPEVAGQLMTDIMALGGDYDWKVQTLVKDTFNQTDKPSDTQLQAFALAILAWEKRTSSPTTFDYSVKHPVALQLIAAAKRSQKGNTHQAQMMISLAKQIDSGDVGIH